MENSGYFFQVGLKQSLVLAICFNILLGTSIGSQVLQASFWKAKRLKDESDPTWERSKKLSPSNRDPVLMTFAEKSMDFLQFPWDDD